MNEQNKGVTFEQLEAEVLGEQHKHMIESLQKTGPGTDPKDVSTTPTERRAPNFTEIRISVTNAARRERENLNSAPQSWEEAMTKLSKIHEFLSNLGVETGQSWICQGAISGQSPQANIVIAGAHIGMGISITATHRGTFEVGDHAKGHTVGAFQSASELYRLKKKIEEERLNTQHQPRTAKTEQERNVRIPGLTALLPEYLEARTNLRGREKEISQHKERFWNLGKQRNNHIRHAIKSPELKLWLLGVLLSLAAVIISAKHAPIISAMLMVFSLFACKRATDAGINAVREKYLDELAEIETRHDQAKAKYEEIKLKCWQLTWDSAYPEIRPDPFF